MFKLNKRFSNPAPIDADRGKGLLVLDTIGLVATPLTGISLSGGSVEALTVAIMDGSGNQITTFGGGTQYTNAGVAAANPIGTGIIFNNGGTYNFVSAAQPLPITGSVTVANASIVVTGTFYQATQPVSGTFFQATQPVSGSVIANAGTGTMTVTEVKSSGVLVGQAKIAVTGTAIQLALNTLNNGVIITAKSANVASISIGTSVVTNIVDGTGNGYILEAGSSISFAVSNTNTLYINGTAGDIISFAGS